MAGLVDQYPIVSIEDGLHGKIGKWQLLTQNWAIAPNW